MVSGVWTSGTAAMWHCGGTAALHREGWSSGPSSHEAPPPSPMSPGGGHRWRVPTAEVTSSTCLCNRALAAAGGWGWRFNNVLSEWGRARGQLGAGSNARCGRHRYWLLLYWPLVPSWFYLFLVVSTSWMLCFIPSRTGHTQRGEAESSPWLQPSWESLQGYCHQ